MKKKLSKNNKKNAKTDGLKVLDVQQMTKLDSEIIKETHGGFDDLAKRYPESVIVIEYGAKAPWGHAYYGRLPNNELIIVSENWDTSG